MRKDSNRACGEGLGVLVKPSRRCRVIVLLIITLGFPVFAQRSDMTEIPFQFSRLCDLILIRAAINGKPAVLIFDTGCNHTIISSKFVDVASSSLMDRFTTEKGSGHSAKGVFTNILVMKVGPLVWQDHQIVGMETEEISRSLGASVDGLLGLDFLKEFKVVTVDLRRHKLILQ
jgi:hypothetical protein